MEFFYYICETLINLLKTPQTMTRKISLVCVFILWLTSLQSATIHHKVEFDPSKITLNTQEFDDTLATVIAWGDMSSSGFNGELPYTPMLEVGKEWRYTLWNDIVFGPDDPRDEGEMIIRIEDCKEIDGKKYYTLASYVNGEKDEAENGTYFSEDCEEKKVYCNYINHTGEINTSVYFDFVNPLKGNISGRDIWDEPIYPTTYEAFGRSYSAFECGDQKRYRLVEGLGFISSEKLENIDYAQCLGTILTGPILGCTGYCTIPKIYEIVNGAGEVLYYLPSARPGASAKMTESDAESIDVSKFAVEIRSSSPIGDVTVYTPAGTQVRDIHVSDTRCSIPLTDFAPGVYILRTNGSSRKFTVR